MSRWRSAILWTPIALLLYLAVPAAIAPKAQSHADNQRSISHPAGPHLTRAELTALIRQKIKYVFVIYQENRSFSSYFGTFPGAEGPFSRWPEHTASFYQPIIHTDGTTGTIHPFRIGAQQFAADLDDMDHSHAGLLAKMDLQSGAPRMDRYALAEERKFAKTSTPSLKAEQMGELTMAYVDCDTIPLLWRYASRFVLFDHIFQEMIGPSTLGNISIIAAQTGQTQWALHPDEAFRSQLGVPVLNDDDPFWGSQLDPNRARNKMPVNPRDIRNGQEYATQLNLTFASLPLTMWGARLRSVAKADEEPRWDLADVRNDIDFISGRKTSAAAFGWYQEGYGSSSYDPDDGPLDAYGLHASYVTHHNGPQYFGYVANNPRMRDELHDLGDLFTALERKTLPPGGGVFFVKGGFRNSLGLKPSDPDPAVQKNFEGDDDHEGYSDSQISEALAATVINKIAASPYWPQCVIIINWDDSEGSYDQAPPPIHATGPDGTPITDGPRVPLIFISPYARTHVVAHDEGSQASVVKFVDDAFNLPPLALLPDELRGRRLGKKEFGESDLGPQDAITPNVTDLESAFSAARLLGTKAPLAPSYVEIPERLIVHLPEETGYGCRALGVETEDRQRHVPNAIPADFNPRPLTDPSR
ncbi:MAG: alkaline phosphatase family protein [Terriglobia bacterium]